MKIVVMIARSPTQRFLLDVRTRRCADRVRSLVRAGRYSQAIVTALSGGEFLEEVCESDMAARAADLIITEHSAHWDLTKG